MSRPWFVQNLSTVAAGDPFLLVKKDPHHRRESKIRSRRESCPHQQTVPSRSFTRVARTTRLSGRRSSKSLPVSPAIGNRTLVSDADLFDTPPTASRPGQTSCPGYPPSNNVSRPGLGSSFGGSATLDLGPWTHKVAEPATFLRPVAPDTSCWTPSPSPLGEGRVRAALNSSAPAGAHPSPRSAIQSVRLRLWTRLRRIFDLGL